MVLRSGMKSAATPSGRQLPCPAQRLCLGAPAPQRLIRRELRPNHAAGDCPRYPGLGTPSLQSTLLWPPGQKKSRKPTDFDYHAFEGTPAESPHNRGSPVRHGPAGVEFSVNASLKLN